MRIDIRKKLSIFIHTVLIILISIIMVIYPIYISRFIDNISNDNSLKKIFIIIVALLTSKNVLNVFDKLLEINLSTEIDYELKSNLAKSLLHSSYLDIVKQEKGKLINLNRDIEIVIDYYINFLSIILKNILMFFGIFLIAIKKLSYFSLIFLAMIFVLLLLFKRIKAKSVIKIKNTKKSFDRMISLFAETFNLFEEFYYINKDGFLINRLKKSINLFFGNDLISSFISYEYWLSSIFVFGFMKIAIIIFGFFAMPQNIITLGMLYLFIYYIDLIEDPIMEIRLQLETLPNIEVAKERLEKALELNSNELEYGTYCIDGKVENIKFCNVNFSYTNKEIFKDYNFIFSKRIYALTGPSGSGKSTLINLISRLFDPLEGVIKYNDIDLKELKKNEISKRIEYIDQRLEFEENKKIEDVIKKDNESIKLLNIFMINKNFSTPIEELSNGQYRSLYLIKSLKSKKDILIMDETFLGIDDSKCEVFFRLARKLNKIIIIISHEKRVIDMADEVITLGKD